MWKNEDFIHRPLQLSVDFEAGAGYVKYRRIHRGNHVARTERISDDVFVDYNAASEVLGIEVLAFDAVALSVAQTFARAHDLAFPPQLTSTSSVEPTPSETV